MYISDIIAWHGCRSFRRISWDRDVTSLIVSDDESTICHIEDELYDNCSVIFSPDDIKASDWVFDEDAEGFSPRVEEMMVIFIHKNGHRTSGVFCNDEFLTYLNRAVRFGADPFSAIEAILDAGCKWGLQAARTCGNEFVKRFFFV